MRKSMILLFVVAVLFASPVCAHAALVDNFDSYDVGSWPTGWIANANASNAPNSIVNDPAPSYEGDRALYLYGVRSWAPLAYHSVELGQEFDILASMYFDNVNLGDGTIDLSQGGTWTSPYVRMFELRQGTAYVLGSAVQSGLSINEWHDIEIQYRRADAAASAAVSFFLDGNSLGTWDSGSQWDLQFNYLGLVAGNYANGVTMYFDDVALQDPSVGGDDGDDDQGGVTDDDSEGGAPVPEPATMLMVGLGLAGLAARRKK